MKVAGSRSIPNVTTRWLVVEVGKSTFDVEQLNKLLRLVLKSLFNLCSVILFAEGVWPFV